MNEGCLKILVERDRYKDQNQLLEINIQVLTKQILHMKDMEKNIMLQLQFACAMLEKGTETIDIQEYLRRVIKQLEEI